MSADPVALMECWTYIDACLHLFGTQAGRPSGSALNGTHDNVLYRLLNRAERTASTFYVMAVDAHYGTYFRFKRLLSGFVAGKIPLRCS
jgi:hypothetical protein